MTPTPWIGFALVAAGMALQAAWIKLIGGRLARLEGRPAPRQAPTLFVIDPDLRRPKGGARP